MSPRRRSIAILLAIVYGLSITTSVLFHNHRIHGVPVADHGERLSSHADGHSCGDCDAKSPGEPSSPASPPSPCPGDERDCFVCHFLAQKPIQPAAVSAVVWATLSHRAVRPEPIRLPAEFSPSLHSRAPPVAA